MDKLIKGSLWHGEFSQTNIVYQIIFGVYLGKIGKLK